MRQFTTSDDISAKFRSATQPSASTGPEVGRTRGGRGRGWPAILVLFVPFGGHDSATTQPPPSTDSFESTTSRDAEGRADARVLRRGTGASGPRLLPRRTRGQPTPTTLVPVDAAVGDTERAGPAVVGPVVTGQPRRGRAATHVDSRAAPRRKPSTTTAEPSTDVRPSRPDERPSRHPARRCRHRSPSRRHHNDHSTAPSPTAAGHSATPCATDPGYTRYAGPATTPAEPSADGAVTDRMTGFGERL